MLTLFWQIYPFFYDILLHHSIEMYSILHTLDMLHFEVNIYSLRTMDLKLDSATYLHFDQTVGLFQVCIVPLQVVLL